MRYPAIALLLVLAGCNTAPPSAKTIADNQYCTRLYSPTSDEKIQCLYERSIGNNDPRDPRY
ncbi:MAG: hypothetical protein QHC90_14075 [Shinella sp.]|jgi:hypothetical protein|nr:hypothetical protein [Shinella sp.]